MKNLAKILISLVAAAITAGLFSIFTLNFSIFWIAFPSMFIITIIGFSLNIFVIDNNTEIETTKKVDVISKEVITPKKVINNSKKVETKEDYYVYLIENQDNQYKIGQTDDIESLSYDIDVKKLSFEKFTNSDDATDFENRIYDLYLQYSNSDGWFEMPKNKIKELKSYYTTGEYNMKSKVSRKDVFSYGEEKIESETKKSYVYLMENSRGHYKIGKANNPENRLKALRTGDPSIKLVMVKELLSEKAAYDFEKFLQDKYRIFHKKLEWFLFPEYKLAELKSYF